MTKNSDISHTHTYTQIIRVHLEALSLNYE